MRVRVSKRGSITIPAEARRRLGIEPGGEVDIIVMNDHLTIRPVVPLTALAGALSQYAIPGGAEDWDKMRPDVGYQ